MIVTKIKLWQWLLIAVTMGLVLAWVRTGERFGDGAWRPGIAKAQFESLLRMTKLPRPPAVFRNITIYPTIDNKTYVSGEFLVDLSVPDRYRKFEYFATDPADVRSFLQKNYPKVNYTYAWWRDVRFERTFWFALPMCVLGLICPALIRAFAARPKLAAAEAEATTEPTAPLSITMPDVDVLAEPIEPQPQATQPVVVALSSQPLEAVPVASEEEEKDYKGEYYPVARNVTPKH